jgi:5-methylcytosine-specific restriction endonuclease McrA
MKRCTRCDGLKSLDMFSNDKSKKDGKRPICLECDSRYRKTYRATHLEEVRAYERKQTAIHAEDHRARVKLWRESNPEKVREYNRKWVAANPEKAREIKRRTSDPERVRKWVALNPEKSSRIKSKWKLANREKVCECSRNRRARTLNSGGKITAAEWEALKMKYGYTCLRCKRKEPTIELTLDHVKPIVQGGENSIKNAQPLCRPCNSSKGAKWIDYR